MLVFMLHQNRIEEKQPNLYTFIETFNVVVFIIFILEFFAKFLCMGLNYYKDGWNIFDFTILAVILITKYFFKGKGHAGILRVFRLGRVLKLINRAENLRMIFNTFLITLPSLASIGLLLFIVIFIYTIMGNQNFAYIKHQNNIDRNANFEGLFYSILTLFRVSTGEGWNFLMDDVTRGE